MGVIFLNNGLILAVGGKRKIFKYFRKAFSELYTLARLLNTTLHICFLDKEAYESFRDDDTGFIASTVLEATNA